MSTTAQLDLTISSKLNPSMEDIDNLSVEKLQELQECFYSIDEDRSGKITAVEFKCAVNKLNLDLPPKVLKGLFLEYDTDGDNNLSFEEFIKFISKLDPRVGQEIEINKAFKLFDTDKDGYISLEEVRDALNRFGVKLTEDDIDMLFNMTDDNNDGRISHTEFRNMLFDAVAPDAVNALTAMESDEYSSPRPHKQAPKARATRPRRK